MDSIDDQIEAVRKQLVGLPGWSNRVPRTEAESQTVKDYMALMNEFQRLHVEKQLVKEFLGEVDQL